MKIAKETLNALKNMPIITLNTIHDLLEVKQHINNYQRNTNKKIRPKHRKRRSN